jgi:predicted metal-dependent enzyme (double-stranded beta helix superfamily)
MNAPTLLPIHNLGELGVGIARLRGFVVSLAELVASTRDEAELLESGAALLARLVAHDDWLPDAFAQSQPDRYQQYLLHCDSRERFSVVSFVWGPGQGTPIHDHRVWGLVGVLRGAERVERFERGPNRTLHQVGAPELLRAGEVEAVSPRVGDIHRVTNAAADTPSISIHVYGANIGAVDRATYLPDGTGKRFISGYANDALPNLWDKSAGT